MRIALLHNVRPERPPAGLPDDAFEEFDAEDTVASVAGALRGLPAEVDAVPADRRLPWRLQEGRFDFAFNMAEGEGRRCREAIPAAVCELLGLPYTGSDALTLALTLDKALARRVVSPDVPVARGLLVASAADEAGLRALA
jgi:D-alanine-D-alanine ligase